MNFDEAFREQPVALVADDDMSIRLSMSAALAKAGFTVIEAENGLEAVASFLAERPDLVLLDVVMPEMDGFDACRAIRNLPGGSFAQVLMVTGHGDTDSIESAFKAGANDFVVKPLNLIMLGYRAQYMLRAGRAFRELKRNERRLAKTQEIARLGNWEIDLVRNRFHCSRQARLLLGLEGEEELTYNDFLAPVDGKERERVRKTIDTAIETREPFTTNYRIMLADGTPRHILNRGEFYFNESGVAEVMMGAIQDVSQIKRQEEEKKKLQEQLFRASKMEAIGFMAGGVAHDLNNILSGIVGYPEVMLQKLPEDSELRKPIEEIHESGKRAATVVADLLTVAKGAARTQELHNLNDLVREHLDSPECTNLLGQYPKITCQYHNGASRAIISCSPVHVTKCVMNLVINAFEAIGDQGTVTLSTQEHHIDIAEGRKKKLEPGEYVVLGVRDTGPGISVDEVEHIFEPFYTRKVMGRSGTGLGLTVVWNTMEDHGGTVVVESSAMGSLFELYFPLVDAEVDEQEDIAEEEELTGNSEHILVIDDEPQLRDIATQMLRILGYRVDSVCSGELALEFLQEHSVDLLLIDMLMDPGMNGRQTYEEIIKLYPGQKAIIASGFSENEDTEKTLQLGAGGFIRKPYSLDELGQMVRQVLRK
jgi:DNA-binding response OmpR family regulator/nitrogen-specific signal transduction histidine kinase